jgi:MFS transporter
MLGIMLAALDQTIVFTSIRTIADDLHGLNLQAWATTAYLITAAISTPLYGKLSDLYGRKPYFLTAISVFVVGSVLCTISTSMYELAAFRALQGLGAGGLMSLALAIIGDIVPLRERARYQGYILAVFGTASVIGPAGGRCVRRGRLDPGDRQVAVGVPGQRPDHRSRIVRRGQGAQHPAHPPRTPHRLDRCGGTDRRGNTGSSDGRARPGLGLGFGLSDRLLRLSRSRPHRVWRRRTMDR